MIGEKLADRYVIEAELGRGGMGGADGVILSFRAGGEEVS